VGVAVYYAPVDYREFLWVLRPETLHSGNLVARPQVSIVIFDPTAPIGTGQGVYGGHRRRGHRRRACRHDRRLLTSLGGHGGREWTVDDVEPPAEFRLYRATASVHYMLGSIDRLVAVNLLR
jgi:hypothetical protein